VYVDVPEKQQSGASVTALRTMRSVNKAELQIADVLWMNTPAVTLAEYQTKQLTVYFIISQRGSVNRFQVWDGLEMLIETVSLETAVDYYNAIQLQSL
jgi:hypothetical protein